MNLTKLRPIIKDDLATIVAWRNDPIVNRWLSDRIKTMPEAVKWYESIKKNPKNRVDGIYEDNRLIGYSAVESVDMVNRRCEIALIIGDPACWGRRIARAVMTELLRYCLAELKLHRVFATVVRGNERSERLLRSLGFTHEGTNRESLVIHGRLTDLMCFSMLEHEYSGA